VGDDRRGVSQTDPRHAWRRGHLRWPFLHIHRAPDVPDPPGTGDQVRYVRRVRRHLFTQHDVLLLLLPGDQKQDAAGDRGVVPEQEETEKTRRRRRRYRHSHRQLQQQQKISIPRHRLQSAENRDQ